MTPEQHALIVRIHAFLADKDVTSNPPVREVSMFGGVSIMVNDKMIVAAQKDGDLLVRVPAEEHEKLLTKADADQAEMGTGRDMGPGWITVAADPTGDGTSGDSSSAVVPDDRLAFWLTVALAYNRTVTGQS